MKKLMLLQLTLGILFTFTLACTAKVETPQTVSGGVNNPQSEDVGPFDIKFDANSSFAHTLKINIKQDDGFVEYKINPGQRWDLVVEENQSLVTGCDASSVKHDVYWLPDETNKTIFQVLKPNSKFYTGRKTPGVIIQSFKGLQNCTSIELKTIIRKESNATKLGQVCEGFSSVDQCKLTSYCKEKNVSQLYFEIEVWNQQGLQTAKKFLVRNDGTRNLMSSYTVSFSDSLAQAIFASTADNSFSLKVNNINYDGIATEKINSQTYTLNLACEL